MLGRDEYRAVIEKTQLVSIDLVLASPKGEILVGLRRNAPAKGLLFVPGGRVQKNEVLRSAIKRIALMEIGFELQRDKVKYLGVYDHLYKDNFVDNEFGTHYVCHAVSYDLTEEEFRRVCRSTFRKQHEEVCWLTVEDLMKHKLVHKNVKSYFVDNPYNGFP